MPRTPAQNTPARRRIRVMDSVSRRLDGLDRESQIRIVDWMDALVDGDPAAVDAEIKAMKAIAGQFAALDNGERVNAVRWVNENYGTVPADDGNPDNGDGPRPL